MPLTFPRKEKLKSRMLLGKLYDEGAAVKSYPLKLLYLKTELPEDVPVQATVSVPKRSFRKAVDRNHIKRLLREAYRLNKPLIFNNIEGRFAFLFLYIGKETPSFTQVNERMAIVLNKFLAAQNDENND